MEFKDIIKRAIKIRAKYEKFEKRKYGKSWGREQILQGLVVDMGDLTRLIMEKEGWRKSSTPSTPRFFQVHTLIRKGLCHKKSHHVSSFTIEK